MHILTARRPGRESEPIELEEVTSAEIQEAGRMFAERGAPEDTRLARVGRAFFAFDRSKGAVAAREVAREAPPALFREKNTQLLRAVHHELVLRFAPKVSAEKRRKALEFLGLRVRATNRFVARQLIVHDPSRKWTGAALVELSVRAMMQVPELELATPNFVSEYVRGAARLPTIPAAQWHLRNRARAAGQLAGEDVRARGAWRRTLGRGVVVAVLDDGVDVEHPNLRANVLRNPDPSEPRDVVGRDFFIPDDEHPGHFDPRPKLFQYPYDKMTGNDIHGTPCAGVIAARGRKGAAVGIAPRAKILAVKVFHADQLASDARVADAIRHAALHADILSCSWSGAHSPDVELALEDAGTLGRGGKGSAVFVAAGNGYGRPVAFPARLPGAIAIGASTDTGELADYSNVGPQIALVAPSSGGVEGIFTTDVSYPSRGFNIGRVEDGGADGLHTNDFGGTSSATPLAAGVAALVLSLKPALTAGDLRTLLTGTARKIGRAAEYDARGHSNRFGFGCVNAEAAVGAV
jgi:subtilisin family serine protease